MQELVQVMVVAVVPAYAALEAHIGQESDEVVASTTVEQGPQNEEVGEHGEPSWAEKLVAYLPCVDFAHAEAGPQVFEESAAEPGKASMIAEVAFLSVYLPP